MTPNQPLLLFGLLLYIALPGLYHWLMDPAGHWLRPFGLWLAMVLIALGHYLYKTRRRT